MFIDIKKYYQILNTMWKWMCKLWFVKTYNTVTNHFSKLSSKIFKILKFLKNRKNTQEKYVLGLEFQVDIHFVR